MAGFKKQLHVWLILGVLILLLPVFWHNKAQHPFLFPKELLVKALVVPLLGACLWRYNKFFSIFIIYVFIHSFLRLSPRNLWALGDIRDFFLFYLLLRLILDVSNIKWILWLWLASLVVPLTVAWLQFIKLDPLHLDSPQYLTSGFIISGFFGHTHFLTSWLGLCAPLVFLLPSYFPWIAIGILSASIIAFQKPGGLVILLISIMPCLYMSISKRLRRFLIIILPVSALAIIICAKHSYMFRVRAIINSFPFILNHPFYGHGFNSYGGLNINSTAKYLAQAHNEILQLAVETGIFSLMIFPFLIYYIKNFRKMIYLSKEGPIIVGLFLGFCVNASYSFPFHLAHAATLFLTTMACCDTILQRT